MNINVFFLPEYPSTSHNCKFLSLTEIILIKSNLSSFGDKQNNSVFSLRRV